MSTGQEDSRTRSPEQSRSDAAAAEAFSAPPPVRRYFVKFEGNNSKRWDGKEIELQGEWLESLYSTEELTPGKKLTLPWPGKGKKVTEWNVVVVDPGQKQATQVESAERAVATKQVQVKETTSVPKQKKKKITTKKSMPKKRPESEHFVPSLPTPLALHTYCLYFHFVPSLPTPPLALYTHTACTLCMHSGSSALCVTFSIYTCREGTERTDYLCWKYMDRW